MPNEKPLTPEQQKKADLRALHEHYFGKEPLNLPKREPDAPEPSPYSPAGIRARYLRNINKR
jgi:hypothetical protein